MNQNKAGLAVGGFFAFWHLVWVLFVGAGVAQSWTTWYFQLHFLDNPFVFLPFNLMTAIWLIIITGVIGYVLGWIFACCWNWAHKK